MEKWKNHKQMLMCISIHKDLGENRRIIRQGIEHRRLFSNQISLEEKITRFYDN